MDDGFAALYEPAHQTPQELELALANPLGLPRVLLMGPSRAGKTSLANVVLSKMSPHETLFLEPTSRVSVREVHTSELVHFQLIDFPGGFEFLATPSPAAPGSDSEVPIPEQQAAVGGDSGGGLVAEGALQPSQRPPESGAAMVAASDARPRANREDEKVVPPPQQQHQQQQQQPAHPWFDHSLAEILTPRAVFRQAPSVHLVFVIDAQDSHEYTAAVEYFLSIVAAGKRSNPKLHCHIFIHKVDGDAYLNEDHKIDAQREIRQSIADELQDARLDVHPTFFLTSIYDHTIFEAMSKLVQGLLPQLGLLEKLLDGLHESCVMEKAFLFDAFSKVYVATDSNPVDAQTCELCSDMIDVVIDVSCIYGLSAGSPGGKSGDSLAVTSAPMAAGSSVHVDAADSVQGPSPFVGEDMMAFDEDSACVIHLSNNLVLYLGQVHHFLALVCLMRKESFANAGIVEYNLNCFKQALGKLIDARLEFQREEIQRNRPRIEKLTARHLTVQQQQQPQQPQLVTVAEGKQPSEAAQPSLDPIVSGGGGGGGGGVQPTSSMPIPTVSSSQQQRFR